jgi:hypothetical protein
MNGNKNRTVCFGVKVTEGRVTNRKTFLGSSPGEDVGFYE